MNLNLNQLLLWIVCLSCILFLLRASHLPQALARGWAVVSGAILGATGLSFWLVPSWAGWIGGGLWVVFLVIPLLGFRRVNQLLGEERYSQASRLASRLYWLHPADGWVEHAELLRALELGQKGHMAAAQNLLKRHRRSMAQMDRTATALGYWMEANWPALLAWLHQSIPEKMLFNSPELMVYYLRAMGETGDLNRLLEGFTRLEDYLKNREDDPNRLNQGRLYALAFCGQTKRVRRLLDGALKTYCPHGRQFWLATAQMAAGRQEESRQQLLNLRDRTDGLLQNAIAWRLSQPLAIPSRILTPSSTRILSHIGIELKHEARYGMNTTHGISYATYGLIACNVLLFVIEILLGGSENSQVLYHLGALVPEEVWKGQWWRLVSATFLHFGIGHLAMNMLGLYILGVYVESALRIWRYLTIYFVSGVGSMLVTTILAVMGESNSNPTFVVGASGAVMGLIGAIAAILLWGWWREKARIARDRLQMVLLIVGLQTLFDLMNPKICFVCHASGIVLGFMSCGFLLAFSFLINYSKLSK